jgi:hypothetical protein
MKIPICDHIFHVKCLRSWLIGWQKCPTCEQNIIKLPEQQKQKYLQQFEDLNGRSPDHSPRMAKEDVIELNQRISEESGQM